MRRLHALLLALGLAALLGGCPAPRVVVPPAPQPVPGPVEPQPDGRVLTLADVAAVALGSPEADVRARFGAPLRVVPNAQEGVTVLLYRARTDEDPTRYAEFWMRDGKVVNKVVY